MSKAKGTQKTTPSEKDGELTVDSIEANRVPPFVPFVHYGP